MAADKSERIEITGLKEFQNGLKQFDSKIIKSLAKSYKAIGDMVIERAQVKAEGQGGVAKKAAEAGAMKSSTSQAGVTVRLGSKAVPYALGAEFGGGRFRAGKPSPNGGYTSQFKRHKGREGYFLYPTIREAKGDITELFFEAVDKASKDAFPT